MAPAMANSWLCTPSPSLAIPSSSTANRHYSSVVAAERAGLKVVDTPTSGEPDFKVNVEDFIPLIEQHKPKAALLTYPDGNFGNVANARRLGDICHEHNVAFIINGAYSVGRMPVSMKELNADFIIGSGHKSMAAAAPSSIIGMAKKWESIVLRKSERYPKKDVELLGCTLRGGTLMTLMASFPEVRERVKTWDRQVEKAQWFIGEMEKLGFVQTGEKPHRHDLIHFEAPQLGEISKRVRERGFFVYKELKDHGIWGPQPGMARSFKLSTFARLARRASESPRRLQRHDKQIQLERNRPSCRGVVPDPPVQGGAVGPCPFVIPAFIPSEAEGQAGDPDGAGGD